MSVIDRLRGLVSSEQDNTSITLYECQNCGNTFESMKVPQKAKCMECLSNDVSVAE